MIDKVSEGQKIRSIRVGDVFAGKLITVGQRNHVAGKDLVVTRIEQDREALDEFGQDVYNVYVDDSLGWNHEMLWQTFKNQPFSLTYECGGQGN